LELGLSERGLSERGLSERGLSERGRSEVFLGEGLRECVFLDSRSIDYSFSSTNNSIKDKTKKGPQ
jgi:hypothetical protein